MKEYARVVNVDAAVARDDRYLLIERAAGEDHAAGTLSFPGGKLEDPPADRDAIAATATRELREEVGVEVATVEYVYSSTVVADDGTPCLNVVVACEYESREARVRDRTEVAGVEWLRPAAVRERDPPDYLLEYLRRVRAHRGER